MSHKKYAYVFVEILFLLLVQLLVKNIISSFDYWKCDLGTCGFGLSQKLKTRAARILNVCPVVDDLFPALGRWQKLNHRIHVSCNHYNHGSIPENLRSLDLCLVTVSLPIDWFLYQLFKENFPFYARDELWNSFAPVLNAFYTRHPWKLGLICVQ